MTSTLLIVDDSATTRALIQRTVSMSGLAVDRVLEAGDGREALATARREHVDLILTDLNMPVMGGAELVRAVFADEFTRHIPVIVVSADPNASHQKQLLDAGARGFIRKPFTPEKLRDALAHLLPGAACD